MSSEEVKKELEDIELRLQAIILKLQAEAGAGAGAGATNTIVIAMQKFQLMKCVLISLSNKPSVLK